ncbi:unnamed protein product [Brassica oleracea]|nr:unnamed protein product [Brassica napus]
MYVSLNQGIGHSDSTNFDADLSEYKKKATIIVEEYFSTNDVLSVANELEEIGMAEYRYYFVKKLVSMAMDRNDKEKEMVAFLLSTLYANAIDPLEVYRGFNKLVASADDLSVEVGLINTTQVTKGFSRIIDSVEDLSLDIPEARSVLQSFISKVAYEGWLCASSLKSLSAGEKLLQNSSANVFKDKAKSIVREYFPSGDTSEVVHRLETEPSASSSQLRAIFVKYLITLAMDRKKREKEMACVLVCSLGFPAKDVRNAFSMLIESADDTALDNPVVVEDLAMFLARDVVDEVLAPRDLEELGSTVGGKVIQTAKTLLEARLSVERILRFWGGGGIETKSPGCTVSEVKEKIQVLLEEYASGGDLKEACRCVKELGMPFFHHEVVKKSVVRIIVHRREREEGTSVEAAKNVF